MSTEKIQRAIDELIRGGIHSHVPSFDASFVTDARIKGISIRSNVSAVQGKGPVAQRIETLAHRVAEAAICLFPGDGARTFVRGGSTFIWREAPQVHQILEIAGSAHFTGTGNRLKCTVSAVLSGAKIFLGAGTSPLNKIEPHPIKMLEAASSSTPSSAARHPPSSTAPPPSSSTPPPTSSSTAPPPTKRARTSSTSQETRKLMVVGVVEYTFDAIWERLEEKGVAPFNVLRETLPLANLQRFVYYFEVYEREMEKMESLLMPGKRWVLEFAIRRWEDPTIPPFFTAAHTMLDIVETLFLARQATDQIAERTRSWRDDWAAQLSNKKFFRSASQGHPARLEQMLPLLSEEGRKLFEEAMERAKE